MQSASLFLAVRYLRPTRSFISIITVISMLGVMLGVGVLVFVMSVFSGWQREYRQMLIGFEPHATVQPLTREQGENWRQVREALAKRPEVLSAVPVAEGWVVVENNQDLKEVNLTGMSGDADNALLQKLKKHIVADSKGTISEDNPREPEFELAEDTIIINDKFAEELGVKVGDTLVVNAGDSVNQFIRQMREIPDDAPEAQRTEVLDNVSVLSKDLTLVAIIRSDTTGMRGYVPLHIAQELFSLDGYVSAIDLELREPSEPALVMEQVQRSGVIPEDWGWHTWVDQHAAILDNVKQQRVMMWFLLLFIMLVASICVMNTTITVTVKKRREIGILTALGTRAWQIITIFVSQAGIVALCGVALGLLGGFFFLSIRNVMRDALAKFFHIDIFSKDIYFLSEIPSHTEPLDLLIICSVAVVLCLGAALVPSWFAAKVDPAVALRDAG